MKCKQERIHQLSIFFSSNECINSTLDQQPNELYNIWLGEGGEENGEEVDFFLCLVWEKMGNVMDLTINK